MAKPITAAEVRDFREKLAKAIKAARNGRD
jgi:hypothetical protein